MIKKIFEIKEINSNQEKIYLFYGVNEGLKTEKINHLLSNINKELIFTYEEKDVLKNLDNFVEKILSKSLFESNKYILIKRATDKIIHAINEISEKEIDNVKIIINAGVLEKKSKLRSLFEKSKNLISVAFYPDNFQTLSQYAKNYLGEKKISISPLQLNYIIDKCNNDRGLLLNELQKILCYCGNGKKLTLEVIIKLINLSENYSMKELIDSCLVKNKKKTIKILNENNFNSEDSILIVRTFINKLKKILILTEELEKNRNIELTLSSAKPPIFWKDKETTKQQLTIWKSNTIKELIYNLTEIELQTKKNIKNSIALITNFILEQASVEINN